MVNLVTSADPELTDLTYADEEDNDRESAAQIEAQLKEISEIALSGTDWTTETILNQLIRGNIQLNPRFQRRDAWNKIRKSRFIESIILGFPIPQIVLAASKEKGKYIVLDGKQRLLTLLQFYGASESSDNNNFSLINLELRVDLNGKKYKFLEDNIEFDSVINSFSNQTIRTIVIRSWQNESLLYKIFLRLNQESTALSPQEFRQALHPGEFVNFLDDYSIESKVLKKIFNSKTGDFRMRDVELLLRYVAFHYFLCQYDGRIKLFLNMTCDVLNREWNEREDDIKQVVERFEEAVEATINIFGKNFARVWQGETKGYITQFNRATLDIMVFYFADPDIRETAKQNKEKVEDAFKALCADTSNGFRESVKGKTDVNGAYIRLSLWGKALSQVLGIQFKVPELVENRIVFNGFR